MARRASDRAISPSGARSAAALTGFASKTAATVRRLQEFIAHEPQVAFGPVALQVVVAEALALTEARWEDDAGWVVVDLTRRRDRRATIACRR